MNLILKKQNKTKNKINNRKERKSLQIKKDFSKDCWEMISTKVFIL